MLDKYKALLYIGGMNPIELNPMQRACKKKGSQKKMAEFLEVSAAYVNQLCKTGAAVPASYCSAIEVETGISRRELRPNDWMAIWPELAAPVSPSLNKP
jgi:DNA-binding transcriptional regulator YdaS (Cro superfamily)